VEENMAEEQCFEGVICPECRMFATVRLTASGLVKTDLGADVSKCRHGLIGMAVMACSSFRPEILAAQLRLRGDPGSALGASIAL
jgi:hypothetical protein